MFDNLQINGFRSIKRAELDSLNRVNFFIGPNNCGKSSFLEAIYLLSSPLNIQAFFTIIGTRSNGFRLSQKSFVSDASWLFYKKDLDNKIALSGTVEKNKYSVTVQLKDFRQNAPGKMSFNVAQSMEIGKLSLTFTDQVKNIPRTAEFSLTNTQGWAIPVSQFPALQHAGFINPHWHSDQMVGVNEFSFALKNNFTSNCIELIKEFDPQINDVKIILDDDSIAELYIESKDLGLYPITLLGDGYKRLFLSSVMMAQVQNGCLLMDEFDSGIHYKALGRYVEWLILTAEKYNIQLFLSTHSFDVLDVIAKLDDNKLNLINLYKIRQDKEKTNSQCISGLSVRNSLNDLGVDLR
jgi:AAA15 family ATPase/GTPase